MHVTVSYGSRGDDGAVAKKTCTDSSEVVPMKPSKRVGQHEGHEKCREPDGNHMLRLTQVETTNAEHE